MEELPKYLNEGKRVAIHCRAGHHRTGTVLYLVLLKMANTARASRGHGTQGHKDMLKEINPDMEWQMAKWRPKLRRTLYDKASLERKHTDHNRKGGLRSHAAQAL